MDISDFLKNKPMNLSTKEFHFLFKIDKTFTNLSLFDCVAKYDFRFNSKEIREKVCDYYKIEESRLTNASYEYDNKIQNLIKELYTFDIENMFDTKEYHHEQVCNYRSNGNICDVLIICHILQIGIVLINENYFSESDSDKYNVSLTNVTNVNSQMVKPLFLFKTNNYYQFLILKAEEQEIDDLFYNDQDLDLKSISLPSLPSSSSSIESITKIDIQKHKSPPIQKQQSITPIKTPEIFHDFSTHSLNDYNEENDFEYKIPDSNKEEEDILEILSNDESYHEENNKPMDQFSPELIVTPPYLMTPNPKPMSIKRKTPTPFKRKTPTPFKRKTPTPFKRKTPTPRKPKSKSKSTTKKTDYSIAKNRSFNKKPNTFNRTISSDNSFYTDDSLLAPSSSFNLQNSMRVNNGSVDTETVNSLFTNKRTKSKSKSKSKSNKIKSLTRSKKKRSMTEMKMQTL